MYARVALLVLFSLTFCDCPRPVQDDTVGNPFIVTASMLRMRERPSLTGAVVGLAGKGEKVLIQQIGPADTIDGISAKWYQIQNSRRQSGWIFGGYAKSVDDYFQKARPSWITLDRVPLYAQPEWKSKAALVDLPAGIRIEELDKKGNWLRIRSPGFPEGWIYSFSAGTQEYYDQLISGTLPRFSGNHECGALNQLSGAWLSEGRLLLLCYSDQWSFQLSRSEIKGFENVSFENGEYEMDGLLFMCYEGPPIRIKIRPSGLDRIKLSIGDDTGEFQKQAPVTGIPDHLRHIWRGPDGTLNLCKLPFLFQPSRLDARPTTGNSMFVFPEQINMNGERYHEIYLREMNEPYTYSFTDEKLRIGGLYGEGFVAEACP
ncbi:SH3 domain-containing protein [Leptonema illini]|uniref:SH3 type 3 domain protein n=1 Tax=Leptonema illini DSM 21528 TaxID=929563 RepID=H2CJ57_9LEPT|nr:SH3 domain-containing protein [Leptonema illini]EHQ04974.1 hypothetical protein Lepil_0267 [Leptonema illini DSM 21528]